MHTMSFLLIVYDETYIKAQMVHMKNAMILGCYRCCRSSKLELEEAGMSHRIRACSTGTVRWIVANFHKKGTSCQLVARALMSIGQLQ